MESIVVMGGGVGGTLVANLISRKLKRWIDHGVVSVTVVDETGAHVYQPGFMDIALGDERVEHLRRPERSLLDDRVSLAVSRVVAIDEAEHKVELSTGGSLPYDHLVIATGCRIVPEEIPHFREEAHHFYSAEAALRLRTALDAFTGGRIVVGIADMPYKCPPAPLEVAFLIEAELRQRGLRDRSELHFCSPIGPAFIVQSVSDMATQVLTQRRIDLHTSFDLEAIGPARKVVRSLEGEELSYDLLILVPPHRGAQVVIDSGIGPPPGGWVPTDLETLEVRGRRRMYALGDATDLPLSKVGSTAQFEAPVVAERIAAAVEMRDPEPKHALYDGRVTCFFEIGDGKGTVLRFDYTHTPEPPTPNRLWHVGKLVSSKTNWHTVPRGRV